MTLEVNRAGLKYYLSPTLVLATCNYKSQWCHKYFRNYFNNPPQAVSSKYTQLYFQHFANSTCSVLITVFPFAPLRVLISYQQEHRKSIFILKFCMPTFKAFKRACSSSNAACFSLSSTFVRDRPVLAREETALERVVALK